MDSPLTFEVKGSAPLTIRSPEHGDVGAIAKLHSRVWRRPLPEEYEQVSWSYRPVFEGKAPALIALTSTGVVVGTRPVLPWRLSTANEKPLLAGQLHGTAVAPELRRRGLFSFLTQSLVEELTARQFDLIFNVSVPAARAGNEKLGWDYGRGLRRYVFARPPTRKSGHQRDRAMATTPVGACADQDLYALLEPSSSRSATERVRTQWTPEVAAWRLARPSAGYLVTEDPAGHRLLTRVMTNGGRRMLTLGTVSTPVPSASILRRLVRSAMAESETSLATSISSVASPLSKALVRIGFVPNPRRPNLNLGVRWLQPLADGDYPLDPKTNWDLRGIDIDTF